MAKSRTEYFKKYRELNRGKLRNYNKTYNKQWRIENGYQNDSKRNKKYIIQNRTKYLAHRKVEYYLTKGKLKRSPCEVCTNPKSQGHHPDYSKPLEVIWLCSLHHKQVHLKICGQLARKKAVA